VSAEIVNLGPHDRMTPQELFTVVQREPWEKVIVVGFHEGGDGSLVMRSSHMSREFALWIIEHAKLHVLDRL
jgi:hypothetical protein